MTAAQSTQEKLLSVLAGSTTEGEAFAAWRQLRKRKPSGWLFDPADSKKKAGEVYLRGWSRGFDDGYREANKKAQLRARERKARGLLPRLVLPRDIPLLPDFVPIRLQGMIVFLGWYGLISYSVKLVMAVLP